MVKLSLRLQTIFEMVPESIVADVGSDHGKLMIALFESGKISHGYAIENKKGPYNRLVKALESEMLIDNIVPLFSDGLDDLPETVNTVVIAGMGGNAIIDILKKNIDKLKHVQTLIIDAHSCLPKIRKEISEMGYVIANEKIIKEDGIFYEILKFIRADKAFYTEQDLQFGPILRNEKSTTFKEKYEERIRQIDNLLTLDTLPEEKIVALKEEKHRIEGVLWIQTNF